MLDLASFRSCDGTNQIKSSSVVDRVVSKATGKVYARKRINRAKLFGHDKQAQRTYENELKVLHKIVENDHLIKVRGTYTDKKYLVMLLEPVADENLKQYMNKGPLTSTVEQTRLRTYFGCLAHTIRFLHDSSIETLHKDIKPENILLKDGYLILTDFGTAFDWSKTGQSMTRSNIGDHRTPRYQSPEVATSSEFHRSSDIWSLGVVFLEMVTVLRGKYIAELDTFLQNNGNRHTEIHLNLDAAMNWFEQLQVYESGSPIDNEPLSWIKRMLNRVQSNRPTAAALFQDIAAFNDGMFCGNCCLDAESTSSEDEEFQSDDDMFSDVVEHDQLALGSTHQGSDISFPQGNQTESLLFASNEKEDVHSVTTSGLNGIASLPSEKKAGSQSKSRAHCNRPSSRRRGPQGQDATGTSDTKSEASQITRNTVKAGPKPMREKEAFVRWLASLPEMFKAPLPRNLSVRPASPSDRPKRRHPTVQSGRIGHFLSSLPEEVSGYESSFGVHSEQIIEVLDPSKRSQTLPTLGQRCVKRSCSQEELARTSHLLAEESDNDQFFGVTNSKLIHYASDSALNLAFGMPEQTLREAIDDLKVLAAANTKFEPNDPAIPRKRLKLDSRGSDTSLKAIADSGLEHLHGSLEGQTSNVPSLESGSTKIDLKDSGVGRKAMADSGPEHINRVLEVQVSEFASSGSQSKERHSKGLGVGIKALADLGPEHLTQVPEGQPPNVTSIGTPKKSSDPPSLGAYLKGVPKRRRRHWESATVIMDRILDDKISEAPTSLMSINTRSQISQSRPVLRWNDKYYGYLPSFVANGKVGAVKAMLSAGCNPGTAEKPRWAPVYNAVRGATDRHTKCLRALVSYGVNVNAVSTTNGRSPLHYAIEKAPWPGYSSVVYTLLAAKANPNAKDKANDVPLLMLLAGDGPLPNEKREALYLLLAPNFVTNLDVSFPGTLDNPLHLAIRRRDAYTVDVILEKMKQVQGDALGLKHQHNGSGFTPLLLGFTIFTLLGEDADGELRIIKLLLEHGANPDDQDVAHGETPLHLVVRVSKNAIALELLCKHSAKTALLNKAGQSAVHVAQKLRSEHPKDKWYAFAKRRMLNTLKDKDYRPPGYLAFLEEEAGLDTRDLTDDKKIQDNTTKPTTAKKAAKFLAGTE